MCVSLKVLLMPNPRTKILIGSEIQESDQLRERDQLGMGSQANEVSPLLDEDISPFKQELSEISLKFRSIVAKDRSYA